MAINKIPDATKDAIKRKSAYSLPNRPSDMGMKPEEIKRAFWSPVSDTTKSIVKELDRIVDEANETFDRVVDDTKQTTDALKVSIGETDKKVNENTKDINALTIRIGSLERENAIIDYPTTITSEQFGALWSDRHSCVYFIEGSQNMPSASLTFVRTQNYTRLAKDYIDFWSYDGLGMLSILTLTRDSSGTVSVTRSLHKLVPLGSDGKIASLYLPSYVDDVVEFDSLSAFPSAGESGKIYVAKNTNCTYRWGGTRYAPLNDLQIGEEEGTAYSGAKGKQNAEDIAALTERVNVIAGEGSGKLVDIVDTLPTSGYINQLYRLGNDLYISDGTAMSPTGGDLEVVSVLPEVGEPDKIYRVGNDLYVTQMIA